MFLEGDLGELEELALIGSGILEVRGSNGVLRVELGQEETDRLMSQTSGVRA